jgi:glycosyltransferase involved in cell wall biosynthesis
VVLLSTLVHANIIAILASVAARKDVRVYVREATTASIEKRFSKDIRSNVVAGLRRWLYPLASGVIANSKGVAKDLISHSNLERRKIFIISNGLNVDLALEKSREPVDHAFFNRKTIPVIVSVGRLSVEKDFSTLILAFKKVLLSREAHLLILGEGSLRRELEGLIRRLGLEGRADLPGFVHNPYKYVCRSEVFVLSSLYEGFPNSLLEAMVVGTPVVATDCQSGPREILEDGRYGALVRLGDVDEMAQAILAALDDRLAKPSLTHLRDLYSIDHIARRYEQIL